jgi:hypothetical protein
LPTGWNDSARGDPCVAVVFVDPDCAGAKPDERRPFADADQSFDVANRAPDPFGELSFRENFLQLATP